MGVMSVSDALKEVSYQFFSTRHLRSFFHFMQASLNNIHLSFGFQFSVPTVVAYKDQKKMKNTDLAAEVGKHSKFLQEVTKVA